MLTLLCATQGCVDRQGPDYTELRTVWQTVSHRPGIVEFWQHFDCSRRPLEMKRSRWVSYDTRAGMVSKQNRRRSVQNSKMFVTQAAGTANISSHEWQLQYTPKE